MLSLVEARYGSAEGAGRGWGEGPEDLERVVFRFDGAGGLVVSQIDQEMLISEPSEGGDGQAGDKEERSRESLEDQRYAEVIPPPEPCASSLVPERIVDLASPSFDPRNWPADAHARCHIYSPPNLLEECHLIPQETTRVVYLSVTSHRVEGNAALAMALWLSESLGTGLDVLVRSFPAYLPSLIAP